MLNHLKDLQKPLHTLDILHWGSESRLSGYTMLHHRAVPCPSWADPNNTWLGSGIYTEKAQELPPQQSKSFRFSHQGEKNSICLLSIIPWLHNSETAQLALRALWKINFSLSDAPGYYTGVSSTCLPPNMLICSLGTLLNEATGLLATLRTQRGSTMLPSKAGAIKPRNVCVCNDV